MEGAAQTFLHNAGQLLREKYRQLSGVGGEVDELRDDVATMNALLRMQSEAEDGAVDHFVREWMKQVRELAYDAEDCIDLYLLRVKCRPCHGVRARLEHLFATLFPRNRLACEIAALRARATAISERHARYGVNRKALRRLPSLSSAAAASPRALVASTSAHSLRRANNTEHHQLIGIGDQVDALAMRLKDSEERSLKVLSVVGFGGLGKTTLAMEVCRRLEAEFPFQAMVSVSQAFEPSKDLRALLKRVLEQVVQPKTDDERGIREETALGEISGLDDVKLATKLEELLKGKRYLIVIDDIWTIRACEAIQSMLPENNCGSRIIVTTRLETVATACSSASVSRHYIHRVKPLNMEDSKTLFLSRAFGFVSASYPKELEDVMGSILKDCGGLPLAIVSIASVLAGYRSSGNRDKWETVHRSIGFQMESNPTLEGMRQIVTLSYNHLPHELKGCMVYLSIFPEDYEIDKYRLLCRWIAEGLVLEKRGLTLMEVAESYLEDLVSRNMIEVGVNFGYHWRVDSCRVHDMLLEVMVSKALECNFVSILGGQHAAAMSYGRIRRLSVQGSEGSRRPQNTRRHNKLNMSGSGLEGMDVEHVRSLSVFQNGGEKLLDHLDKFTLLRVLDMEGCEGLTNDHLRCICRLYLLRFLSLKGTDISQVPPQIEKLEHLQTLDVRDAPVRGLPETLKKLYKLERLQISVNDDPDRMWRLPLGLKKMKALREVGFTVMGNNVHVAKDVGELEQLQEMTVYVDDVKFDPEVLQELAKSLSKSHSLRRLIIGDVGYAGKTLNFLHQIHAPPRLLRYLMIAGGIDGGLPPWIGSLKYLVQFNMSWGKLVGDQLYDGLCDCPSLKTICIQNMCCDDRELVARTKHAFPELTNLRVASSSPFPHVIGFEGGSMVKLETLLVNFTDNEEKRIVGVEHLTSLKEVQLLGHRNNPALGRALEQLKAENTRRRVMSNSQFQVVVKCL
ncbi:unnamed protein product [Urochloa decumbens]|uniref:Uncharacterized protein n=1 Tax=Urochloa decumbens TaxID=240449 RepID=A0ABC9H4B0_9POAL